MIIAAAALHQRHFSYTADDAFIAFRFARNWAAGQGPVFNPGESPVEGYTNFLWMAWMAFQVRLGVQNLAGAAWFWGMICAAATMWLTAAAHLRREGWSWIAGPLLLAASAPFVCWAGAGLETPLFTLFLVGIVRLAEPLVSGDESGIAAAGALGALCGLSAMCRPEGVLLFAVVLGTIVLRRTRFRIRRGAALAAGFLALYLPYFIWRFSYYGQLLPNTFYAKSGDWSALLPAGVRYLGDFLLLYGAPLLPLLWFLKHRKLVKTQELFLFGIIAVFMLYLVWIGGDFMPYFRFLAPLYPLFALLLIRVGAELAAQRPGARWLAAALPLWVVGFSLWPSFAGPEFKQYLYEQLTLFPRWEAVGKALGSKFPPTTRIACTAVGRIPYFSGLPTLDMLGLNDRHIAHLDVKFRADTRYHEKYDAAYVLQQHPDILLASNGLVTEQPSIDFKATLQEIDLFADKKRFEELYQPVNMKLPDGRYLAFFISKDSGKKAKNGPATGDSRQ